MQAVGLSVSLEFQELSSTKDAPAKLVISAAAPAYKSWNLSIYLLLFFFYKGNSYKFRCSLITCLAANETSSLKLRSL